MSIRLRSLVILVVCILAGGCKGTVQTLSDLSTLQAAIIEEYGEENVGINLTDRVLTVTFVNSALNTQDPPARAERAQKTATFVSQHYPAIKEIEGIWVHFLRLETRFLVFHFSEGMGIYAFDGHGVRYRRPEDPSRPQSEQYTTATYSPTSKLTDVVAGNLQLDGDINDGLLLTPHYSLAGNVTAAEPSATPPKAVIFDFFSSSNKSLFPGAPKITFLADEKIVYSTSAQFSTSKFDEKFSELLSLPIPYPAFLRMVSGKTMKIRIGEREYLLSNKHFSALLELRAYVKE